MNVHSIASNCIWAATGMVVLCVFWSVAIAFVRSNIHVYCILFYVDRSIEQLDGIQHHHQTHDNTQPYSTWNIFWFLKNKTQHPHKEWKEYRKKKLIDFRVSSFSIIPVKWCVFWDLCTVYQHIVRECLLSQLKMLDVLVCLRIYFHIMRISNAHHTLVECLFC